MSRVSPNQASGLAWVESSTLPRLVERIGHQYSITEADLQDLTQETRVALLEAGTEVMGVSWVMRVVRNKAVDIVRRNLRARARDQTLAFLAEPGWQEPDLQHLLKARVDELPSRLRQFYELHYEQGWSQREVAAHLGKCRASVRWLDRNCRVRLAGTNPPIRPRKQPR